MNSFYESLDLAKEMINFEVNDKILTLASKDLYKLLNVKGLIYKLSCGGQYINHYTKHIINRLISNKQLKGIYLYNMYSILLFLQDECNGKYLSSTGLDRDDILKVKGFVLRALKDKRWINVILAELNYCSEGQIIKLAKVNNLAGFKINDELFVMLRDSHSLKWRYYIFLIFTLDSEGLEKLLKLLIEKADIVNIKYPILEPKEKRSDEYIIINRLLSYRSEYSKIYEDIIDLVIDCNDEGIVLKALNVVNKWNIPYYKKINKARIDELISSSRDERYKCMFIKIKESLNEGDFLC